MALNLAGDGYITGLGSNQTEYGMPAGSVIHVAMNTAPNGYLKADGTAVSRTTYDKLFTAIGTTYGTGDGSTTFNLPDLRGEFIRCWDDNKGTDSDRTLGSAQGDLFKSHTHALYTKDIAFANPDYSANTGDSPYSYRAGYISYDTTGTGGTETRPRNIALLACIKY